MSQLTLFGVPDIQESTCQVPCGEHSIWDALEASDVTQADCWVYQVINKGSNWQTGRSHAKSYDELAKLSGIQRAYVIACVNRLVAKGWIEKSVRNTLEKHSQNTANTYLLTHHKCEQHEIPLDKDGCPLNCAVPTGQGSVYQLVEDGVIHWKEALYWLRSKIESDWVTGIVRMTIAQAKQLLRMKTKTICAIRRKLAQVGLLERISKPFTAFICQLFPKPYKKRRKRRRENPKGMRCEGEFYYSFNGRWRVSWKDGRIETKIDGTSTWRHANEFECNEVNEKLYRDFKRIIDLATSPEVQRWREKAA